MRGMLSNFLNSHGLVEPLRALGEGGAMYPGGRLLICCVVFLAVYALGVKMVRADAGGKVLVWIDGELQENHKGFDWIKTKERMMGQGMAFYNPKFLVPHYWIFMHMACAAIGCFALYVVSPNLTIAGLLAVFLPEAYFTHRDKADNEQMMRDVMTISSALVIQMRGGEYLGAALAECREIVSNKRLKHALREFNTHLKVGDLSMMENIEDFESKFTGNEIRALCIILKQAIETGLVVECAQDLSNQCSATKEALFEARKAKLDRLVTIAMLVVFADGIAFVMWRFLENLITQL